MTSGTYVFLIIVICLLSSSSGETYKFLQIVEQCRNFSMCNGTKHQLEDLNLSEIKKLDCPCYACSCLQNCSLYGNCCPDRVQPDVVPLYTCFPFYIGHNEHKKERDYKGVLVMNRCPENTLHPREAKKCHSPTDPTNIFNPPVTSLTDQVVYKNKHCARCNGVSDYIAWSVHLQCPSKVYLNIGNGTLMPSCLAYYVAPVKSYRSCHYKPTDSCNVTGYWKTPDPMLIKGCATAPRQIYAVGVSNIYHNAYCLFCNQKPILYPRGSVLRCLPSYPRVPFTKSLLLNFNTADDEEKITCPTRYMFDSYKVR